MGLFDFFRKPSKDGVIGIEIGPDGMGVAFINGLSLVSGRELGITDDPDEVDETAESISANPDAASQKDVVLPRLECKFIEGANFEENARVLKSFIQKHNLTGMPTRLVLHPDFYEMFFVDRPEVEDDELDEAVRWKIKDLVTSPLSELVIDAFCLPDDAYRGSQKKVYAVATQRNCLERVVAAMQAADINLQGIDIGELAIRNIANLIYGEKSGVAMLRLREKVGSIELCDGGQLYLTRQIESGTKVLDLDDEARRRTMMDDMLLEIQRSLDFYYSQLGKGAIRNFMVAPTQLKHHDIDTYLKENLGINVSSVNLNSLFDTEMELSDKVQQQCFAAVGAALSPQLS